MMAKEIIANTRKIAFPAMNLSLTALNLPFHADVLSKLPSTTTLRPSFVFDCNEVVSLEKHYPQFRPDVSVSGNGEEYLIEITVTHKINADKVEKVKQYGLPMLEIDLSGYVEEGISRADLQEIIVSGFEHKTWICLPGQIVANTQKFLTEKANEIQRQLEALAQRRNERFSSDNYANTLKSNRNDYAFNRYAQKYFHFEVTHNNYPFFIDIPISGEILFKCDRRIWQGKIFDRWVYYRTTDKINLTSIWNSLKDEVRISYDALFDGKFLYPGVAQPAYLPYTVIRKYFDYLEKLGFVAIDGYWAKVKNKRSLTPPNTAFAIQLNAAINQVDDLSPFVSTSIDQLLREWLRAEQERRLEEEMERQRKALEQKLLQEEAEKKAAEEAKQKELEIMEAEILNADYDQTHTSIVIGGTKWFRCTQCLQIKPDCDMALLNIPTRNKGTCRPCSRLIK